MVRKSDVPFIVKITILYTYFVQSRGISSRYSLAERSGHMKEQLDQFTVVYTSLQYIMYNLIRLLFLQG